MSMSNDIDKLASALAKAQGEMEGAKKDKKNEHFRSKYADLASCWDACRDPLSKNGLSVSQFPLWSQPGTFSLQTILMHESGQYISSHFSMPVKDATNPQAVGSAASYARRYALCSVVGIAPSEDDANMAAGIQSKPDAQVVKRAANIDVKSLEDKFNSADLPGKKAVFQEARESGLPEPIKLNLMQKFSDAIRSASESNPKK